MIWEVEEPADLLEAEERLRASVSAGASSTSETAYPVGAVDDGLDIQEDPC